MAVNVILELEKMIQRLKYVTNAKNYHCNYKYYLEYLNEMGQLTCSKEYFDAKITARDYIRSIPDYIIFNCTARMTFI